MKSLIGTFSLLLFFNFLPAQEVKALPELELELAGFGELVVGSQSETERLSANTVFDSLLYQMLLQDDAFDYAFAEVKNLSSLKAENNKFRMFTWLVPLKNGTYSYNGYALVKTKSGLAIEKLIDQVAEPENVEYAWLKAGKWFGAIYYQAFEVKFKKNRYQIFLGYRPGNREVQEKIVEVIAIEDDKIRFGEKIFETPNIFDFKYNQRPYRLRFKYAKKVVASVKWFPNESMIIMDHLTPPDASLKGEWKYYGPDFSYDALYWEKGKWHLKDGVEFNADTQSISPSDKPSQGLEKEKE